MANEDSIKSSDEDLCGQKKKVSQTYWAQEQGETESGLAVSIRQNLISRFGGFSLAYSSAVQPKLMHFGDDRGYIAYRKRWGMTFVLGDPVTELTNESLLIDEFLKKHRRVSFCQLGKRTAQILSDRGFYLNQMGVDTTLDLVDYNFNGKEKEWLRYAANWTRKRDFEIIEVSFKEVTPQQVEEISEAWRKTRTVKHKEVRFLNRPIVMDDEPGVRKFFLFSPERQIQAFVFLDPLYRDGEAIGYVTSFKRRHPAAPLYAEHAIMKHIIETLKGEGVEELKLGLSPLAWIEDEDFRFNRITNLGFKYAYRSKWLNKKCYNLVGHAEYKRRFRGREEKVYFASSARFNTPRMLALVGLCGIA